MILICIASLVRNDLIMDVYFDCVLQGLGLPTRRLNTSDHVDSSYSEPGQMHTIPRNRLSVLFEKAVSQRNFAVLCMREMFTDQERVGSTVTGKCSYKRKLDPTGRRLQLIYNYVMQMYNIPNKQRHIVWTECQLAMTNANLYLKRTINEANSMPNLIDATFTASPGVAQKLDNY